MSTQIKKDDDEPNDGTEINRIPPPKPQLTFVPDLAIEFSLCDSRLEAELPRRVKEFLNVQNENVTSRCFMRHQRAAGWSAPLPTDPQARAEHLAARERGFKSLRMLAPTGDAITFGIWICADYIRREAYIEWGRQQKQFGVDKRLSYGLSVTGSYELRSLGPIEFEPPDGLVVSLEAYARLFIFGWFPILVSSFRARNKERISADDNGSLTCAAYDSTYPTLWFPLPILTSWAISDPLRDLIRSGLTICTPLTSRMRLTEIPFTQNEQPKRLIFKYAASDIEVERGGVVVAGSCEIKDPAPLFPSATIIGPDEVWAEAEADIQEIEEVFTLQTNDLEPPLTVQWSSSARIALNNPSALVVLRFDVSRLRPGFMSRHWIEAEVTKDNNSQSAKAQRKQIVVYRQRSMPKPNP